jgi:hypothetical protein
MFFIANYGYSQEISHSYEYPVKPGTDEWRKFQTQDEMIGACQIPETILKKLTTEALVETCLSFPLYPQITAFNNMQNGFNKLADKFNGFAELFYRNDAGLVLLQKYITMDALSYSKEWSSVKKGQFIYEFLFIEMLLAQDRIIEKLNHDLRIELAKESLKKYEEKIAEKDLFGLIGLSHTSYVMLQILNIENITEYRSLFNTDEKIKVFQETANTNDSETLNKIKEMTTNYVSKK